MSKWIELEPSAGDIAKARLRIRAAVTVTKSATDEVKAADTEIQKLFEGVNAGGVFHSAFVASLSLRNAAAILERARRIVEAGADEWPTDDDWEIG